MAAQKKASTKTPKPMILKVGHRDIEVVVMKPGDVAAHDAIGLFKRLQAIIEVDIQHKPQEQGETLLHEVLHALIFDRNVDLSDEVEERVVDALSKAICALVRDNPGFFDMIRAAVVDQKSLPLKV